MQKISLIIPVYNGEKYIRLCLDSAVRQSYKNYEVLLVDDGSTDCSYEIAKEYQQQYDFFKIIHRSYNQGLVYSWQEGVRAASGDYIAFLDSDDWVDSEYLEHLASGISEDADMICCNHNRVFADRMDLYIERIKPGSYTRNQFESHIFPMLLNDGSYLSRGISPHRCGKLFRKDILLNNMPFSDTQISYGEDLNILFPSVLDCQKLIILPDPIGLYYYRQNEESIIHTYKRGMFQQIMLLRDRLFCIMKEKSVFDFTEQLDNDFWCLFMEYVKNEAKAPNLFQSSKEVFENYQPSRNIPCHRLALKKSDRFLLFCLQQNRQIFIYFWMVLYTLAKKV